MVEKFPFKRINFMTNEQYETNTQQDNELYAVETPCIIEKSDESLLPSWYRVWSDGWIEQGGKVTATTAGTVTFLKPFNTLCTIFSKNCGTYTGTISGNGLFNPKTWSNTQFTYYMDSSVPDMFWYACGY